MSCFTLIMSACSTKNITKVNMENTDWESIKIAIANCEVTEVFQAHSLDVSISLKNWETINWVEPWIDDIFTLIKDAKEKCGNDIVMATE